MKKLFVLLISAGFLFSLTASGQSSAWYQTAEGQVSCKKISDQGDRLRVVLDNGEKKVIPAASVSSYFIDDRLLVKKELFIDGLKQQKFMEFMKTRDDMTLFLYADKGSFRYLVYKGDELFVEIMDGNRDEFMRFFHMN